MFVRQRGQLLDLGCALGIVQQAMVLQQEALRQQQQEAADLDARSPLEIEASLVA